jgi:exodeoxyribonuclease-3
VKIISWNVNGIRAIQKKGFLEWLASARPDILCLQEIKAGKEQLGEELITPPGYTSYWCSAEKKGYSGVALYSRAPVGNIEYGLGDKPFDTEGRTIRADLGKFILYDIYFPNGGAGNKRVPFKMAFYEYFLKKVIRDLRSGRNVVVCGDVNTAHEEIDLARPKENMKNTGFLPQEREWVSRFLAAGFVDTFRHFCTEPGHYSWWDYKTSARDRNIGWRIDYFFINRSFLGCLEKAYILNKVMGSDHCPVGIELNIQA